jgi:hypothetical protein
MPAPRRFDIDELLLRPGTYFNPETEILVVIDDSAAIESDLLEEGEGGEWLLVSDDLPVDEPQRDALLEAFQARHGGEATGPGEADEDVVDDEDELEPDPDPDEGY